MGVLACFLLDLIFDTEDVGSVICRNVDWLSPDYRYYVPEDETLYIQPCENLKSDKIILYPVWPIAVRCVWYFLCLTLHKRTTFSVTRSALLENSAFYCSISALFLWIIQLRCTIYVHTHFPISCVLINMRVRDMQTPVLRVNWTASTHLV
jgi:hypothetical protein